jgi:biotin carboxyl carrier protein
MEKRRALVGDAVRYVIMRDGREIPVELAERPGGYAVTLDGRSYEVSSECVVPGLYSLLVDGESYEVTVFTPEPGLFNVHLYDGMRRVELVSPIGLALRAQGAGGAGAGMTAKAPMPGKVVRVLVKPGQRVAKGDGLVVVEAMKMQNELQAGADAIVREVRASEGENVEGGAELVILDPAGA